MSDLIQLFAQKYPYTDFHELNLDFLLNSYRDILTHIDELEKWMSTHKGEYQEALQRLEAVENEINTFEDQINKEFDDLSQQFADDFAQLRKEIESELADTEKEIIDTFNSAIAEFTKDFNELKKSVESDIISMELEIRQMINYINARMISMNEDMIEYVDDRLADFIQHLPDYENLIVYNPLRGIQTNVQTAINDLYGAFSVFGLTAQQYDALQLTAEEYDKMKLTAQQYDQYGYKYLNYPDPQTHMRDPFTGLIALNSRVIYELADLHREALTAWEYDHLGLTAEEYDTMQLSAYFYDWYGIRLWDSAITAQEYDDLELTAWNYDSRRLTSIQYDNYAKVLLAS